ncbi:plasmid replication protein RepC [Paenirhodobacter sp.]|uniref:plasmid replication protein RepC n=1 Tax=Paenirhodobacter sp. TaxID=1965326 RepID=UPI003B3E9A94
MRHISTTPFGRRAVDHGLLVSQALAEAPAPVAQVDKWQVFHALRTARAQFGLSDRDLTVLNALLSFLPERTLAEGAGLIVFPSNATLSDRAHGMAESTLRRHLAALVNAGMIARHDSPNGKRYARHDRSGAVTRAFGFSLRPLLVRAGAILNAAEAIQADLHRCTLLRETITLRLRDAGKLLAYLEATGVVDSALPQRFADLRRIVRRKLPQAELTALLSAAETLLRMVQEQVEAVSVPTEMSGKDSENERHYQSSKPEKLESESCTEKGEALPQPTALPLEVVLEACPDVATYARHEIRSWPDLVSAAGDIHPMMGIDSGTWSEARRAMGPVGAAATLAAMLQKMSTIRNPGGYLRRLSAKAVENAFTPVPMIMALLTPSRPRPLLS